MGNSNLPRPRIVAFSGPVQCRREDGPLGLTLEGNSAGEPQGQISLAFSSIAGAPPSLPETLHDVIVEWTSPVEAGASSFRLRSGQHEWEFRAAACHLHREVSRSFYHAIPPRQAPWSRRLLYRTLLALLAWPIGKRLLRALRRR